MNPIGIGGGLALMGNGGFSLTLNSATNEHTDVILEEAELRKLFRVTFVYSPTIFQERMRL